MIEEIHTLQNYYKRKIEEHQKQIDLFEVQENVLLEMVAYLDNP